MTAEGWVFEGSDPSVGIFSGGWMHDACPVEEPGEREPGCEIIFQERINEWTVRTTYKLTCYDCNATAEVTDDDEYDPSDELQAKLEAEYWETD